MLCLIKITFLSRPIGEVVALSFGQNVFAIAKNYYHNKEYSGNALPKDLKITTV